MTVPRRYRLRFSKQSRVRFISHHDLMQVFERALRRADIPVMHSQGFNPRPKLTFALALPLGVESLDEVVDIDVGTELAPSAIMSRLSGELPDGISIHQCDEVVRNARLAVSHCAFSVELDSGIIAAALQRWQADADPVVIRDSKDARREIHLKQHVVNMRSCDETLAFDISYVGGKAVKPAEVLQWLGLDAMSIKVVKLATVLEA